LSKLLILPAEILSRELDARILQGLLAVERGWRVVLGSKALINRNIAMFAPGVYLCQTLTHKRVTMLRLLRRLGHKSIGWDEEGLVYLNRDVYLMRRVSSESLSLLFRLVAWGPESRKDLDYRARNVNLTAQALGNPRFDLLRKELRKLHMAEVESIRKAHGTFVLVNTNFASFNPIISTHDLKKRTISKIDEPSDKAPDQFRGLVAHRQRLFNLFLKDIPLLAKSNPDFTIVVRPHPGEELTTWQTAFKGLPNVKVIREGSSIPWLIAATSIVHNGCTTSAEAAIIGHCPIAYCPVLQLENESGLPNFVSHRAYSLTELSQAIRLALSGTLTMSEEQKLVLENYVSGIEGKLASEAVLDLCEQAYSALETKTVRSRLTRLLALGQARLRYVRKTSRKDYITDRYLEKVFPIKSAAEVAARANAIAEAIGIKWRVEIVELAKNIFEIKQGAARP
jgi:surface carbohydrate biosynthesis protein